MFNRKKNTISELRHSCDFWKRHADRVSEEARLNRVEIDAFDRLAHGFDMFGKKAPWRDLHDKAQERYLAEMERTRKWADFVSYLADEYGDDWMREQAVAYSRQQADKSGTSFLAYIGIG